MKVLVTGGAGFIGSHIAEAYHARGYSVTILDNFSTGCKENVPAGVRVIEMDIRDRHLIEFLEREKFSVINHHAALTSVPESFRYPTDYADVNVTGTVNLLEAAVRSGVGLFIFASTCAVYADSNELPYSETHPTHPTNPYGASKLAAEQFVMMYARQYSSLRSVILRYGNVFGPRQRVYGEGNLVAISATKLLLGQSPIIFGDGTHTRDYVYVGDVADLNVLLVEKPYSGLFNVGTGVERSVLSVCRQVMNAIGIERELCYGPPRPEQERVVLSSAALAATIGWRPAVSFEDGIEKTVEWYRRRLYALTDDKASTQHSLDCTAATDDTDRMGH